MLKRTAAFAAAALALTILLTYPVSAGVETGFQDVDDAGVLAEPITWLRLSGITVGCNPPLNTSFCPEEPVTRGQMAAFLARALDLGGFATGDRFTDDDGSVFENDINRIAAAGITKGCNPPENDNYCPDNLVTREQMAAFIVRAFTLAGNTPGTEFRDVDRSVFAADIATLSAAGVTMGCNPPDNDLYCPDDYVTRSQLATFLWRAEGEIEPGAARRIVAAGDIARCELEGDEATASLIDSLFASTNGVVAALGDTVYNDGSPEQYRDCYEPSWGRHRFRTYPAVGNHEYRTPGATGYFDYFGTSAGAPDEGWYSYDLGGWQVIVLNSNCDEIGGCGVGSAQERWLRGQMANTRAECTVVYMHHPRFSSGSHGDDDELTPLWDTLVEYRAELVLAGHDHHYERLAPLTGSGEQSADGLRSFVVGTGGTYLRSVGDPRPGSEIVIDDSHGVLVLDLALDSYSWQYIDVDRGVLDQGEANCR